MKTFSINIAKAHTTITLKDAKTYAAKMGLVIQEDHIIDAPEDRLPRTLEGYWMLDPNTGEGPWDDENFSTSIEEVMGKLMAVETEREG